MKNVKGALILLIAAFIWGVAFVAQASAADEVGSFTFNASRSFVATIFLSALVLVRRRGKSDKSIDSVPFGKRLLIGGALCGVALFAASNFQQAGIAMYPDGVAAAGRSGFLTATYVVMVALTSVFFKKRLHPLVLLAALCTVAGMYLLCLSGGFGGIYLGDVMELICAVCFTVHILVIDRFSSFDSVKLSLTQFVVSGLLSLVCALIFERPHLSDVLSSWVPIVYTGLFSSGIAYTLQMVGQKYAEPAVASITMSLESVFSVLAGWLLLNERLSLRELFGCALVFAAVLIAQTPEFIKAGSASSEAVR